MDARNTLIVKLIKILEPDSLISYRVFLTVNTSGSIINYDNHTGGKIIYIRINMKEKKVPSIVSYYVVAVASIIWALALPLYNTSHYICFGLVEVLLFLICWQIWPMKISVKVKEKKIKEKPVSTGDSDIDRMVADKRLAIEEMRRLDVNITDERISSQIVHLQDVTDKIVEYVTDHPDKKRQVRRFFNYYLPTTIKLLDAYDRMDEAGISGINIDGTKGKIEEMMDTAVKAYDKQLDSLYKDEALDISTDIKVMDSLMEAEGLKDTVKEN